MGLPPVPQLQPVLHVSQKHVRSAEFVKLLPVDVSLVVQLLQGKECASGPQPGLAPSIHALETLHEKLNVANPAVIDFDVDHRRPAASQVAAGMPVHSFPCYKCGL